MKIFLQIISMYYISFIILVVFVRILLVVSDKNQLKIALSKNNLLAQHNRKVLFLGTAGLTAKMV